MHEKNKDLVEKLEAYEEALKKFDATVCERELKKTLEFTSNTLKKNTVTLQVPPLNKTFRPS